VGRDATERVGEGGTKRSGWSSIRFVALARCSCARNGRGVGAVIAPRLRSCRATWSMSRFRPSAHYRTARRVVVRGATGFPAGSAPLSSRATLFVEPHGLDEVDGWRARGPSRDIHSHGVTGALPPCRSGACADFHSATALARTLTRLAHVGDDAGAAPDRGRGGAGTARGHRRG
jgi:hypothetical protein